MAHRRHNSKGAFKESSQYIVREHSFFRPKKERQLAQREIDIHIRFEMNPINNMVSHFITNSKFQTKNNPKVVRASGENRFLQQSLFEEVGMTGFEPATFLVPNEAGYHFPNFRNEFLHDNFYKPT